MSSLSLLNSSGVMPFLTLTAVFLFIGPAIFVGIVTMWSNLKQKISDELSARVTRIVNDLDTKNNTPEIENIFSKLTAEINTKITNDVFLLLLRSSAESIMNLIINLKLMLGSAKLIPSLVLNLPQKSKKSMHVMLNMPLRRRKFYQWSIM